MATLRHIHQLMNERRLVRLVDGRIGKVVRVDTLFPDNATIVSVWTGTASDLVSAPFSSSSPISASSPASSSSPAVAKVALTDIVGEAEKQSA